MAAYDPCANCGNITETEELHRYEGICANCFHFPNPRLRFLLGNDEDEWDHMDDPIGSIY
jgi:hypothetical protein